MRSTMNFLICSLLLCGCGCASVQRPDSYAWGVNGSASRLEGLNLKKDYDDNGNVKPNAKKQFVNLPHGLTDLNGAILFMPPKWCDPNDHTKGLCDDLKDEGIFGVKAYLGDVRDWMKNHCK